jgi:hypothetical protein
MKFKRFLITTLLLASLTISLVPSLPPGKAHYSEDGSIFSPQVQHMLDLVDPEVLRTLIGDLSGEWQVMISGEPYKIKTRTALSGEPNQKAVQYLFEYYDGLGLSVSKDQFSYHGQILSNIVAEKTGTIFPERIYLISSHLDDMPETYLAPGADDNASGTAGVMIAADILNQYEFGCTLRFVNFNAEEFGKIGSLDYAQESRCKGEDLRGVINLDMIAWNSKGTPVDMDLHALPSVPGSDEIAELFQEVVSTYGMNLNPSRAIPVTISSDHVWLKRVGG